MSYQGTAWVFNTGAHVNPLDHGDPFGHTPGVGGCQFAVIGKQGSGTRATKLVSSYGHIGEPGDTLTLKDDQSGRYLGEYTVLGVIDDNGKRGLIPSRKLPYRVYK